MVALLGVLVTVVGPPQFSNNPAPASLKASETAIVRQSALLLQEINRARVVNGLKPVKLNSKLNRCAQWMAVDLARRGMITHEDLFGRNAADRANSFLYSDFTYIRENLVGGVATAKKAVQSWLDSGTHRENLLAPKVTEVGIGYVFEQGSKHWHYWVANFAELPEKRLPGALMPNKPQPYIE